MALLDTYAWRWGKRDYRELIESMGGCVYDPARIACPILSVIGAKEYNAGPVSRRAQDEAIAANPSNRSKLVVVTAADGGDAHSIATNMSLLAQVIFDWLDEVLSELCP